jgi:hypothetical protein
LRKSINNGLGPFSPSNPTPGTDKLTERPIAHSIAKLIQRTSVKLPVDIHNARWRLSHSGRGMDNPPIEKVIHIITDDKSVIPTSNSNKRLPPYA